jgi:hypothetical protein
MICEIINPSDPYTLETDNFVAAAVGIAIVGRGKLGLQCEDPELSTPVWFGWDRWLADNRISSIKDYLADEKNSEAVAAALDSVLIGNLTERRTFIDAMKYIDDPAKREAFRAEFHDKHRSSMNDIGTACYNTAKWLRGQRATSDSAEPITFTT